MDKILKNMVEFASKNNIPIIEKSSSEILIKTVKEKNPKNILEIGTAIGYSGSLMLKNSNANLTTIEISSKNILLAKKNFENLNLLHRVNLIEGDANEIIKKLSFDNKLFDFIFLDGPKSKYVSQLPYLLNILETNGLIFADDVLFRGLVNNGQYPKHKHRTIVIKLREFLSNVQNNHNLSSKLLEIGNGILIIKKIK